MSACLGRSGKLSPSVQAGGALDDRRPRRRRRLDRSSWDHPGGDQLIIRDLLTNPSALRFEPFREGIEAAWLHREPDGGPAAALLRYQPGARAPRHRHAGWERVIVISGSQADAQGLLKAGDVALNAPGTEHEVFSAEGCLALLVWERQPIMLE